jgi:hypothetical protein
MKYSVVIILTLLCSACLSSPPIQGKLEATRYFAPISPLACYIPSIQYNEGSVTDSFGPHGGTIRIYDYINYTRIDIEELEPAVDIGKDAAIIDRFYEGYYKTSVYPAIESSYGSVELLVTRADIIEDKNVYYAMARVTGETPFRSTILYTDGNYIYAFTTLDIERDYLDWDIEKKQSNAFLVAKGSFNKCSFKP